MLCYYYVLGMLALHYACWQGKAEPVHMLLQWRSPVSNQSYDGATPLHLACQHGHFDVVRLKNLLEKNSIKLIITHLYIWEIQYNIDLGWWLIINKTAWLRDEWSDLELVQ